MRESVKTKASIKKTSFTCSKRLFNAALDRARKNRRSMSGHLQHLIEQDIKQAEALADQQAA